MKVTLAEPAAPDVTVSVLTSPQLANVRDAGPTVATDVSLEWTETTSVDEPVRLQPFLPSPLRGTTVRAVEPAFPPEVRVRTPAVPLRSFLMSSADAPTASSPAAVSVPRIRPSLPRARVRFEFDTAMLPRRFGDGAPRAQRAPPRVMSGRRPAFAPPRSRKAPPLRGADAPARGGVAAESAGRRASAS